jgi:F420-dependent oxidoreductase-like protein
MDIGVIVPQGWVEEYPGWDPARAWARTVFVAQQADALGFESIWLFDHFHTTPNSLDQITFESFTSLSALAALTNRVRIGHVVICTGFRNPALTAKMISTMDVISGGRMELGIGAGWKEDEWRAYGYGFPPLRDRLAALGDHLEVITRMLAPGRATWQGTYASVADAINLPKGIQEPRVPIMVGGNGPKVTWRLAARHADELNLDGMYPDDVRKALPIVRKRCEEIGRDPQSLRVSLHIWEQRLGDPGQQRVDLLGEYSEVGLSRVQALVRASVDRDDALAALAADARAAGLSLAGATPAGA